MIILLRLGIPVNIHFHIFFVAFFFTFTFPFFVYYIINSAVRTFDFLFFFLVGAGVLLGFGTAELLEDELEAELLVAFLPM